MNVILTWTPICLWMIQGFVCPRNQIWWFSSTAHRKYQSWMIRLLQNSAQETLSETGLSQHQKRGRKLKDWKTINSRLGVWPAELRCAQWLVWNAAVLISPICFLFGIIYWFEKSSSRLWQQGHRKPSKFPGNKHVDNCCLCLRFHNFSCCFSLASHVAWWHKQTSLDSLLKKDEKKSQTLRSRLYFAENSISLQACLRLFALGLVGSI